VLEVLYHRAKFGGDRIALAAEAANNVEFFVCLSVTLLNAMHPISPLEYRNDFDAVGKSQCRQLSFQQTDASH